MANIERIYNVPLRKGFIKSPRYKKAKKAVLTLREFLARHMKVDMKSVKIGRVLNETVWDRGIKHPPHHVKVTVIKDDEGIVKAELFGFKYEEPVVEEKEGKKEKKQDDVKAEESKETTEEDVKELEKELDGLLDDKKGEGKKAPEKEAAPKKETKPKKAASKPKTAKTKPAAKPVAKKDAKPVKKPAEKKPAKKPAKKAAKK